MCRRVRTRLFSGYWHRSWHHSHHTPCSLPNKLDTAVHPEFRQQRGNAKFYGSYRDIEIASDFFVRKTAQDAGKNLPFPARRPYLAATGHSAEPLVSLLDKVLQKVVFGLDDNRVIFGNLVRNQGVLGKQSGRLTSQETAGLHVKTYSTKSF